MPGILDRLLDASVVFSFDRSGYTRHAAQFPPDDLQVDLTGRVVLITGATSGIGLAAAMSLAGLGATLILIGRDQKKCDIAATKLLQAHPQAKLRFDLLDMSRLADIRAYAERLPEQRLDVLIHNAGALVDEVRLSPEGFETTLAAHLLGPLVLTAGLAQRLLRSEQARLIFVASGGMYPRRLNVDTLHHNKPEGFNGVTAYADAKRAQVVLGEQLAQRFAGSPVSVYTMHPGWADTPGVDKGLPTFKALGSWLLRSSEQGADTVVFLAASPRAQGQSGLFWFDRAPVPTHMRKGTVETPEERERLWAQVHAWTGLDAGWVEAVRAQ